MNSKNSKVLDLKSNNYLFLTIFVFFLKFFIQMQFIDMRYKQFEEKMQQQRKFSEAVDRTKHDGKDEDDSNESNEIQIVHPAIKIPRRVYV